MKSNHLLWLFLLILIGLWLLLPGYALADIAIQQADTTSTPTPRPLYPDDVVIPKTHFPELIVGAIVIVVIIMIGVFVRGWK